MKQVLGLGCAGMLALSGCDDDATSTDSGSVRLTISGEALALGGYAFPPAPGDDVAFVDGWEVHFDELLVTVDKVTLSANPDTSPTDQSKTGGKVAQLDGPWAVDLHKGGPIVGKGGSDEQSVELGTLAGQNLAGNKAFDPTVRYAFGFDVVAATAGATRVNLDAQGEADYQEMIANGWTVLYVGHATWKGTDCTSTDASYDFAALPKTVKFRLGFAAPTTYTNCQNPDNDPAAPFGDEEHQRGVQISASGVTTVQVTIHTDHPFWESFVHEAPMHFDQYAALAEDDGTGSYVVTLDDTKGVDFTALEDHAGEALPWRSCLDDYTPPNTSPVMGFDSVGIPYDASGSPTTALRDLYDFITYGLSTMGHLNSDGLCFVSRHYASPQ